jgi:hypothetical protein
MKLHTERIIPSNAKSFPYYLIVCFLVAHLARIRNSIRSPFIRKKP